MGLTLDGESPSLRLAHSLWRHGGKWELGPTKTDQTRRALSLSPSVVEVLRRHRVRELEERLLAGPSWEDHGLVFTTLRGRPLDAANIRRHFGALLKRAGLPRQRFHDLRHGTATILLLKGENLKKVSAALGHSRIGTTADVYAHVVEALDRETSDKLETALFGENPSGLGPAVVKSVVKQPVSA
jgi:integrase